MRELFGRLGRVNQIGLIGAFLGFTAGMAAVIVVNPVSGLIIVGVSIGIVAFCFWFFFGREVERSNILEDGEPARATVLEVRSTGVTINEVYPQIALLLEVSPASGDPYKVRTKCLIDQTDMPSFHPGNTIIVAIDPRNRKKVAVSMSPAQV